MAEASEGGQLSPELSAVLDAVEGKLKGLFGEGSTALQDILEAVQRHTNEGASTGADTAQNVSYGLAGDKALGMMVCALQAQVIDLKDGGLRSANGDKEWMEQIERVALAIAIMKHGPPAVIKGGGLLK